MANEDRETEEWKAKTRPTIEQLDKLESFLTSETEHVQHTHYLGDLEQKLPLIKQIYESIPQFFQRDLHTGCFWSVLWTLDVHSLVDMAKQFERHKPLESLESHQFFIGQRKAAEEFPGLVFMCMKGYPTKRNLDIEQPDKQTLGDTASSATKQRRGSTPEQPVTPQKVPKKTAEDTPQKTPKITRNKAKSEAALVRDNKLCVVTNKKYPQVCHIIPFGLLNYKSDFLQALGALEAWYGKEAMEKAQQLLCKSNDNICILDEPANMLTLNGQLHKFWAEGQFMLKPHGQPYEVPVEDDSVTTDVQTINQSDPSHSMSTKLAEKQPAKSSRWCQEMTFNWLGHTGYKMDRSINFNVNPRHKSKPIDHKTLGATGLDPWEPVLDGRLIKVYADRKADLPSYDLLQLQANILAAFSLAASADPMFYESDDEDVDAFSY
ncbi:hypothetical protein CCUS01_08400 [Colletotrichum cuscutae]|uniref:HNH nuclease domain-containing protein n=1 Tax=Colletotrichum cuscutae TaxID=1209917 RepID=A0AAI9UQS5_9PEZI|nr:hypothetical protein CCUS01_08400 [Colletotrichum cuscutae]